jgi:hypothetical protein
MNKKLLVSLLFLSFAGLQSAAGLAAGVLPADSAIAGPRCSTPPPQNFEDAKVFKDFVFDRRNQKSCWNHVGTRQWFIELNDLNAELQRIRPQDIAERRRVIRACWDRIFMDTGPMGVIFNKRKVWEDKDITVLNRFERALTSYITTCNNPAFKDLVLHLGIDTASSYEHSLDQLQQGRQFLNCIRDEIVMRIKYPCVSCGRQFFYDIKYKDRAMPVPHVMCNHCLLGAMADRL